MATLAPFVRTLKASSQSVRPSASPYWLRPSHRAPQYPPRIRRRWVDAVVCVGDAEKPSAHGDLHGKCSPWRRSSCWLSGDVRCSRGHRCLRMFRRRRSARPLREPLISKPWAVHSPADRYMDKMPRCSVSDFLPRDKARLPKQSMLPTIKWSAPVGLNRSVTAPALCAGDVSAETQHPASRHMVGATGGFIVRVTSCPLVGNGNCQRKELIRIRRRPDRMPQGAPMAINRSTHFGSPKQNGVPSIGNHLEGYEEG